MFDPHIIRNDFPIFQTRLASGNPLVYLDSAATSQKPYQVIEAIVHYYEHDNANVHRGIHELGDRSTKAWHEARKTIASLFHADVPELVVTRNTTEALNMVAYAWGDAHVEENDVIIATQMDHHSNLVPWQELARRKNATFLHIPVTKEGLLDQVWLEKTLKEYAQRIKIVAFPHVSNTLGTINPVRRMVDVVHKWATSAVVVVDGAQAAPHMPIHFHELQADFYAVSAHKMLGPMGVGGLFVRTEILKDLRPWLFGGGMIGEVYDDHATFSDDLEDIFTAGTPDVASLVGWAAACSYLTTLGMENVEKHDREMVRYILSKLSHIPEIKIVGPSDASIRSGSVAFEYEGVHAHDVAQIVSSEGVGVRSGHHCTMPLHKHMGWVATTRASFNVYTTTEDIDALVLAIQKVKKIFTNNG